jgi:hypothetical protein
MPKPSTAIQEFFEFFSLDLLKNVALSTKTSASISPGDVVMFTYADGVMRLALVVRRWGHTTGIYTANTGNRLISCFKLTGEDSASLETINIILKELYNKRAKTTYDNIIGRKGLSLYGKEKGTLAGKLKSLKKLFGGENYRTYNINKMQHTSKVAVGEL